MLAPCLCCRVELDQLRTQLESSTLENCQEYKYDESSGNTAVPRLRYSVLNAKPLKNVSPLYKQFTGTFRLRRRNEIEKEFVI